MRRHPHASARAIAGRHRLLSYWLGPVLLTLTGTVVAAAAEPASVVPLALGRGTGGSGAWSCNSPPHSPSTVRLDASAGPEATPAAVLECQFCDHTYNWTWANVDVGGADPGRFVALRLTYRTELPPDFPALNVMLRESTGAAYWVPRALPPSPTRFRSVVLPFAGFTVPAWAKDTNDRLDLGLITAVSVGLESALSGKGRVLIADVELIPEGW